MTEAAPKAAGIRLAELLIDLEFVLRDGALWSSESPPVEAFRSEMPFALDRMSFPDWLQFIFIPTLHRLALDPAQEWPGDCAVAPMAEHYFVELNLPGERVVKVLQSIDLLVSRYSHSDQRLAD